jgi:hypothetical protein
MSGIGRNDLCPCGSGKKYKKCCLASEDTSAARRREEQAAVQTALDWLNRHYPEEVGEAMHFHFLGEPDEEKLAAINAAAERFEQMLVINIGEWLLADAELAINGRDIPAIDLVLGKGGPVLSAHGREWLREIGKRPLSLYEVREVKLDEGLLLADMLKPHDPPVWVRERSATRFVVPWDIFGTRLALQDDCDLIMTGAVYPLERAVALACIEEIAQETEYEAGDPALRRFIIASTIIDYWLDSITTEKPLPEIVDASTGEKVALTTDHYHVLDWDVLERALSACDDVEGSRAEGWTRFEQVDEQRRRSRAALNPNEPNTLQVFCRTVKLADSTRKWLEGIACGAVRYKIREVVDPRSKKAQASVKPSPKPDIPVELQQQIMHEYLARHYETWSDISLPALKGKTPREAVKTDEGRRAVTEILKSIEQSEARLASSDNRQPFDISFLWERLGLTQERSR